MVLAFFDEFVPFYALFALWWVDNGISTARISLIFAVWAAVGLILEIPSGALADRVDRRRLIAVAYGARMSGLSIWLVWPSLTGVLIGTVLWAIHDALASGAWEAMIYDELNRLGHADEYAPLMARMAQLTWAAVAAAALAAWLLVPLVDVVGVGWTSVGLLLVAIALVLRLPAAPPVEVGDEDTNFGEWLATMRAGVRQAQSVPVLGRLVVLGSLVETLTLVEEYIPFLARQAGAADRDVPIILGLAWLGFMCGAELAARRPDLPQQIQSGLMGLGVLTAAVAIQGRGGPWVVAGLAVLHVANQSSMVHLDARLQERTEEETRATVSSVRGFLTSLMALLVFVMMSALDQDGDVRVGLFVLLVLGALSAVLILRWQPDRLRSSAEA